MKVVEENNEKMFTKEMEKDIIKKKYSPLNKDKGFYERMGLYMKKEKGQKSIISLLIRILDLFIFFEKYF